MTHFAIGFPDWNSLDSVRRAHSGLEGAALVFFALLVVFDVLAHLSSKDEKKEKLLEKIGLCCFAIAALSEIAAYPYGQRNDTLSEWTIGSLDAKARKADTNASTALTKSETALSHSNEAETKSGEAVEKAGKAREKVGAVAKRAEEIDLDLASTQYLLSGRSVTNFDSLVGQLKQYKPKVVHIGSTNDIEQDLLCTALYKAAHDAEMDAHDECGRLVQVGAMPTGVVISGPNQQETMDIAQILLHTSNLGPGGTQSAITSPVLRIFVGAKPPFMTTQARGIKIPKKQTSKAKTKP